MPDLEKGKPAPDFKATAVGSSYGSGREVSLADFRGRPLVLYFYPKDETPGCTVQACSMRDNWNRVKDRAAIFGVSADSAQSHTRFIEKFQLPFPLLSDPAKRMVNDYEVWVEKKFMGRKSMGIERSTFVIDGQGRIAAVFRKVKPDQHIDLVQGALDELS